MIIFSNAKINIGLWVLNKREDGYHNICSIFYPIQWQDILEIHVSEYIKNDIEIETYGIDLNITKQENIIFKAYQLLLKKFTTLPGLKVLLYKNVPHGAGLGAGSANAAFFIQECNRLLKLNLPLDEIRKLSEQLGADCVFFTYNQPCIASEKGNVLKPLTLNLSNYYILIIYPNIAISTKDAYSHILPKTRNENLIDLIQHPIEEWKKIIENDFESFVFNKYPIIKELKEHLYSHQAIYASMSGSGSAIFGIFKEHPSFLMIEELQKKNYLYFIQKPCA